MTSYVNIYFWSKQEGSQTQIALPMWKTQKTTLNPPGKTSYRKDQSYINMADCLVQELNLTFLLQLELLLEAVCIAHVRFSFKVDVFKLLIKNKRFFCHLQGTCNRGINFNWRLDCYCLPKLQEGNVFSRVCLLVWVCPTMQCTCPSLLYRVLALPPPHV